MCLVTHLYEIYPCGPHCSIYLFAYALSVGDFCIDGSGSENLDSPDPLTTPATPDPENSYQCLKWLPFKPDECCIMYDDASQRM